MENAFNDYLRHVKSIVNVLSFEIEEYYIGSLIDDIFRNIDDVNRLFKHKFSRRLFCPPVPSQSFLRQATSGKQVRLTDFVATLGLVIDGICHSEVNSLLDPTRLAACKGSIDKIQALLDDRNIKYNVNYIARLRTLRKLRNPVLSIAKNASACGWEGLSSNLARPRSLFSPSRCILYLLAYDITLPPSGTTLLPRNPWKRLNTVSTNNIQFRYLFVLVVFK